MDEAERCHKLAYISYGKLLASGTAQEIIAAQKIYTVAVYGDNLIELAEQLKVLPEIVQTVVFGSSLHVSSLDEDKLFATVKILAKNCQVELIQTSLEDVFIYMMNNSQDNFGVSNAR